MSNSLNLQLPYVQASQAQKHVTVNEALMRLDATVQLGVEDRVQTAPPASPQDGERHIVAAPATGAWAGHELDVAAWLDGAWVFFRPTPGWIAFVKAESALVFFTGSAWEILVPAGTTEVTGKLGINGTASVTDRLVVRSEAALFTPDPVRNPPTGDTRIKVNKNSVSDVASHLFQTNYSTRAEFGLIGTDDFALKVSADGQNFEESFRVGHHTAAVDFAKFPSVGGTQAFAFSVPSRAVLASVFVPAHITGIETRGFWTDNDGGGARYRIVPSEPSHPGKVQSADGAWWELAETQPNVKQFGAVGDDTTDDTAALNDALTYATATGASMHVPSGRYHVPNDGPALRFSGDLSLFGEGMRQSVLAFDDDANASRRDFFKTEAGGSAGDVSLRDLGFESSWGNDGTYDERSQLVSIDHAGSGRFRATRCRFAKSRFMCLILKDADSVSITDCEFYRSVADGARVISARHVSVTGSLFESVNDDAIAIHLNDDDAEKADHNVNIVGNRLVDSQGITCLGAKHAVIANNSITRPHVRGIRVGVDKGGFEGNTSPLAIEIVNNIVTDLFYAPRFSPVSGGAMSWILVSQLAPSADNGVYVEEGDGSGDVVEPWPHLYTMNTDTSVYPGAYFITISGNQCVRTLEPTSNYSNYGFGVRYARTGPVDPQVGASDIGGEQIKVENKTRGLLISNNILSGAEKSILLEDDTAGSRLLWRNVSIQGNTIENWSDTGIRIQGLGHVLITANTLDGDPYHVASQRTSNGKWTPSYQAHAALWFDNASAVIMGNTFRNTGTVFKGQTPLNHKWENNVLACNPAGAGASPDNIGIRNIGWPGEMGSIVIEDGDPESAVFRQVLNSCYTSDNKMPSSGKWIRGHVVRNSDAQVQGPGGSRYVVLGWYRLTNGSSHVLDTDWAELRAVTGT